MTINTKYNLGEKVKIKDYYSAKSERYLAVSGEIKRIIVSKMKDGVIAIKYDVEYLSNDSWRIRGLWEDDLVDEDLTLSAMPKLLVVLPAIVESEGENE